MIIRDLPDGGALVSTQEDHADLAAQFAAHWGNERFARLRPYETLVFAATYHDSGYREWEGKPPMNVEKGRPYAFRERIPSFEAVELQAYKRNVEWVRAADPYAGLLVSMHRTGLWQNRYNVLTEPAMKLRNRSPAVEAARREMEAAQKKDMRDLGAGKPEFERELWHNYRALQVFDLLSLYFCCDGYAGEESFKEFRLAPVTPAYEGGEQVTLSIVPNGSGAVRMRPYPFDVSPLRVTLRARIVAPTKVKSERACAERYHKAQRCLLKFEISR
jgi:hypothetical protein